MEDRLVGFAGQLQQMENFLVAQTLTLSGIFDRPLSRKGFGVQCHGVQLFGGAQEIGDGELVVHLVGSIGVDDYIHRSGGDGERPQTLFFADGR